jgi:hypothetical protein
MHQGRIETQVSAGCLLFMHRACTDLQKSDAADCALYAQLAATKKHPRFAASSAWSDTWLAAFIRFGWALNTHETLSCPALDLGPGSVWTWVKSSWPLFMPSDMLVDGESVLKRSFSSQPIQPAVELLAGHALEPIVPKSGDVQRGQKVVLQIAFLNENAALSVVLISFAHRTALKNDFLFETLHPADIVGNIDLRFYSLRLMDLVYTPLRKNVSQALEDRRPTLVCALAGDDT